MLKMSRYRASTGTHLLPPPLAFVARERHPRRRRAGTLPPSRGNDRAASLPHGACTDPVHRRKGRLRVVRSSMDERAAGKGASSGTVTSSSSRYGWGHRYGAEEKGEEERMEGSARGRKAMTGHGMMADRMARRRDAVGGARPSHCSKEVS